jgi:hypothetical protein
MTTKRTPIRRATKARVTPEIIALWLKLKEIVADETCEEWEPEGRRREYLDTSKALRQALGIPPWGSNPINAVSERAPDYMHHNPLAFEGWQTAWEWRCALEAACGPEG